MSIKTVLFSVIFIYGAVKSVLTDSISEPQSKYLLESYNYNHPPSLDSYDVVPETIYYINKNVREGKSVKLGEDTTTTKSVSNDDNITESIRETKTLIPRKDLEIPVAVIYDKPPEIPQSSDKRRIRKQMRGQPAINGSNKGEIKQVRKIDDNKSSQTLENVTENSVNIENKGKVQTFPKRDRESYVKSRQAQRENDPKIKIVTEKNYVFAHSGNFDYSFEGGDGTKVSGSGQLKTLEDDKTGEAVVGSYSYKDRDGNDYSLSYTADENGYRPVGDHLPTPPPIPPAIARALAYLATKPTDETVTDISFLK